MNRLRVSAPFALLYLPFLIVFILSLGCAIQFGHDFTATGFMGSHERSSVVEDVKDGEVIKRTTLSTFDRRPWGTSTISTEVGLKSEKTLQSGKGISARMAATIKGALKAAKSVFAPGTSVVDLAKTIKGSGAPVPAPAPAPVE